MGHICKSKLDRELGIKNIDMFNKAFQENRNGDWGLQSQVYGNMFLY